MALGGGNVTVNTNTNKSPTRTAVASLITGCCAGPATGIEDIDNGGDGNSYATPMPMEGILEEEEQRGDHHGFYAAASQQQQQRNRFTSSPLIERDSSLIKEQSGLLSLLASGTFTETSPREIITNATSNGNINNNPHSLRRNTTPPTPSMTMMQTPPRSASRRKKHHLQQSSQYSPNNHNNNNSCPPSPAMELSMARQSANVTNQLMSASSPRISRRHRLGSSDSRSVNSASTSSINIMMGSPKVKKQLAAMTIESPTKKARQEKVHVNHNNSNSNSHSIVMPKLDIDEVYSAENTVAPSPTAATTTSTKASTTTPATKAAATATTTMARSTIIPQTSSFSSTEIIMNPLQHKQNIVIWKHYTKSQLDTRKDDHLHHLELWTTTTTTAAKDDNKKKLNEEICNTYKFPRLYLQNPKFMEINHLKELWWYKLSCGAESTLGHVYDGLRNTTNNTTNNNNSNGTEVFDPSLQPINVWSEPSSTTMKVRGVTYAQDGIKVPSEESMFAVLGVDNFVNEKGGSGSGMKKSGTDSFMERWKNVCEEVGLESVPFL